MNTNICPISHLRYDHALGPLFSSYLLRTMAPLINFTAHVLILIAINSQTTHPVQAS